MSHPTSVTVRMYNVGFGDCFLLTVARGDGPWRMLIDCGTHPSSTGSRNAADAAEQILEDLTVDGAEPRIDVVAATHRHRDHVSGFEKREIWDQIDVGQVWLPWTEDPKDRRARDILERMSGIALALDAARGLMPSSPVLSLSMALIENSLRNEKPMETLHEGFAGRPTRHFLSAGFETTALVPTGVGVHVLGPSRDESVIRTMDPPKEESWMHLAENEPAADDSRPAFDPDWAISWEDFHATEEFIHLRPGGNVVGAIRRVAADDLLYAASSLEKSVNGTSLVLAFEIGDLVLLFPGDAQWGTWEAILKHADWRGLIGRARFYKIGHHGSHNATPRTFVDDVLPPEIWAALPFAPVEIWPRIPHPELLAAMKERGVEVLRSDHPPSAEKFTDVRVRDSVSVELSFTL